MAELQREYDTQIAEGGVPVTFEGPLVRDGEPRTMRTTKAPLRDAGGEVVGVIGVSTDVSALRLAEEALRESQAQLAEAQELTSVGSGTWDLASDERCWSDELYRIFGLDRENGPIGYDEYFELVHADELVGEADAAMYRAKAGSREQGP